METIGLFEAKTRLSELIARVAAGDEIVITRHNKPVARLVPIDRPEGNASQRRAAIERLLGAAKARRLEADWRTLRDAGRR